RVAELFELAAAHREPPDPPELAPTWIELVPAPGDPLAALDAWTHLAALLAEHAPRRLTDFDFPSGQEGVIRAFVSAAPFITHERAEVALAIAKRLHRIVPGVVPGALELLI